MIDGRMLQQVLDLYGLTADATSTCQLLASGSGNRVYAVSTTMGKVVLRQSHPGRTRQWLELEAAVLEHLARVDFPAVRQRPTLAGQPFADHHGTFWAAFEYIDASTVSQPDEAQLAAMARLQARLHGALATFPAAERWASWARLPRPRKSWAYIVPLADTLVFLEQVALEHRIRACAGAIPERGCHSPVDAALFAADQGCAPSVDTLPKSLAEAMLVPLRQCRRRLEQIAQHLPDLPGMLTHYDYGQYNVLFAANGTATVIDFDMLCWESRAANLARALSVIARRQWMGPFEPQRARAYLAAYEAERTLEDCERAALPGLLRLFVLQYVIFHALLCIEEARTSPTEARVQAMHDDLQRDDELAATEGDWLC